VHNVNAVCVTHARVDTMTERDIEVIQRDSWALPRSNSYFRMSPLASAYPCMLLLVPSRPVPFRWPCLPP
jgi:hypothetical protein